MSNLKDSFYDKEGPGRSLGLSKLFLGWMCVFVVGAMIVLMVSEVTGKSREVKITMHAIGFDVVEHHYAKHSTWANECTVRDSLGNNRILNVSQDECSIGSTFTVTDTDTSEVSWLKVVILFGAMWISLGAAGALFSKDDEFSKLNSGMMQE